MDDDLELVAKSGWFDRQYYLTTYPDVAALGMDPLEHFLWIGHKLRRNPCARFDTKTYLNRNPDVKDNALLHFLRHGNRESHSPEPDTVFRENGRGLIVFVSGEPSNKPGFVYRVEHWASAFAASGRTVIIETIDSIGPRLKDIEKAELVFVWRARFDQVADVYRVAKANSVPIVYDLDDLMVRPELATPEFIDAIRFGNMKREQVSEHYVSVRQAMQAADFCTASTAELAWQMRLASHHKPTSVLPNGFSNSTYLASRVAMREKAQRQDDLVRIGYASGTRTHQADFKLCVRAVADVLRSHPFCRLVLFRSGSAATLDPTEFPELEDVAERIEWRSYVPFEQLPSEIARFDINLAPLEVGNPFCEAKSELKFFDAAICDVPTIASPTGPFKRAIQNGENGLLAATHDDWRRALEHLVSAPEVRKEMGREAHRSALWNFGPTKRVEIAASFLAQLKPGRSASRAFLFNNRLESTAPRKVALVERSIVHDSDKRQPSPVTVIVPLYNYESYIEETLDTVVAQTLADLDLVVVDDCSTDGSGAVVENWLERHSSRFNRVVLARHQANAGLGFARNTAFDLADSPYVMCLDADNRLRPDCCSSLMTLMEATGAAFAFPTIQRFGDAHGIMGEFDFLPARLIPGNYIDAMAMVSKEAWAFVGGYATDRMGWQDYHLWCKLVDAGLHGVRAPKTLAEYRVHGQSMLGSTSHKRDKREMIDMFERQFQWLSLVDDSRSGHRRPATPE